MFLRVLVTTLSIFALLGCSKPRLSEQEYANEFFAAMSTFTDVAADAEKESSRLRGNAYFVKWNSIVESGLRPLQSHYQSLVPPVKFVGLHRATLHFIVAQVDGATRNLVALKSGNRKLIGDALMESSNEMVRSVEAIIMELDRLGIPADFLREQLKALKEVR